MSLQERYEEYLKEFELDARQGIIDSLASEGYGALNSLKFSEDDQGVSAEAEVQLRGIAAPWIFRRRIILPDGPLDKSWLASTLFSTAMIEDLDTRAWPPATE
ncbi:hypothetical protein [Streptomyces sp. NPDC048590]|uniref:hypothetical protein n=1 Tax=Streptomyces sp. NPDC048590 TaxID=3365574 RepID=UPI00371B5FE4